MISVRNVHKRFGKQIVLRDVSVEIESGMTTTIVGPSGVGKSVLLKLIMGIMKPEHGEVLVDGVSITAAHSEASRNEIRRKLGVLFQSAALFDSLSVYDNIAFPLIERGLCGREEAHERTKKMIRALSLEKHVAHFPQEISIGLRKRVGMARALITEPAVILFDEPNTGLDPLVGQEVYDLIKHCQEQWHFTGVVISHELPEVFQVSDKVIMLLNAQVVAEGSPEEFMNSSDPAVQQFLHGRTDGPIRIQ